MGNRRKAHAPTGGERLNWPPFSWLRDQLEIEVLAVRIYALAKELQLDTKELVDICTRAGIPGKGSALASLSKEEAEKVKNFLAAEKGPKPSGKPGPGTKASPPVMERPQQPVREGRIKVVVTPKPPTPLEAVKAARQAEAEARIEPVAEAPSAPPAPPVETPPADVPEAATAVETPAPEPAAPETPPATEGPGPLAGMVRREDYIGPGGATRRPPTVGSERKPASQRPKRAEGGTTRARPAVKLAPLPPPVEPPAHTKKGDDTPTQKPDMKLPAEAFGVGKLGSKPLAAHLRRAERTLEEERAKRSSTGGTADTTRSWGKKGKGGGPELGDDGKPMLGGREQRQLNRRRSGQRRGDDDSGGGGPRKTIHRTRRGMTGITAPRKERVSVQLPCTVRDLSEASGVPAAQIQRILMAEGVMAKINDVMDAELTELVAAELGVNVDFVQAQTLEDEVLAEIRDREDAPESLQPRPPVVTFLGHVDHGKTSLLDRLIGINVAKGESGGITQHIRAYQIEKDGAGISFIDTPGHEAFTEMRARGANVTDIAVVVVAADDGVMPQTEEAIAHARAAEVPIIVALNKIDLPGVDVTKVMAGLASAGLQPSEWGGDTEVVRTSALTGEGLDELLETILTVADLHEYRANPDRPAMGTALEALQESDYGVVAKMIVQNGTLRIGDTIVCGDAYGRVKAMFDPLDSDVRYEEAGPSTPVNLLGLNVAPRAGERFYVLDDIGVAREIAEERAAQERRDQLGSNAPVHVTLENLFDRLDGAEEVQTLNLILRSDVRGTIEAIRKELAKLEHPEVKLRTLLATVGGVTEGDVQLAHASDAVVIAFNVEPDDKARNLAERLGVQIRRYDVIYKIADDLRAAMEGMLKPIQREVELGRALVQQIFKISRLGSVAGCRVLAGTIERNARARVVRDTTVIGDYAIDTLRREKDDVKEVREGYECGIKLAGFNDLREGDLFDVYKIESVGRSFDD